VTTIDVPQHQESDAIYHFVPANVNEEYYSERTDRQIGWITREEQNDIIRPKAIGVAGCGGMGGALAEIFIRLGINEQGDGVFPLEVIYKFNYQKLPFPFCRNQIVQFSRWIAVAEGVSRFLLFAAMQHAISRGTSLWLG
jgi:hypothetical protein